MTTSTQDQKPFIPYQDKIAKNGEVSHYREKFSPEHTIGDKATDFIGYRHNLSFDRDAFIKPNIANLDLSIFLHKPKKKLKKIASNKFDALNIHLLSRYETIGKAFNGASDEIARRINLYNKKLADIDPFNTVHSKETIVKKNYRISRIFSLLSYLALISFEWTSQAMIMQKSGDLAFLGAMGTFKCYASTSLIVLLSFIFKSFFNFKLRAVKIPFFGVLIPSALIFIIAFSFNYLSSNVNTTTLAIDNTWQIIMMVFQVIFNIIAVAMAGFIIDKNFKGVYRQFVDFDKEHNAYDNEVNGLHSQKVDSHGIQGGLVGMSELYYSVRNEFIDEFVAKVEEAKNYRLFGVYDDLNFAKAKPLLTIVKDEE